MSHKRYKYKYKNYKDQIERGEIIQFTKENWHEIEIFTDNRVSNFIVPKTDGKKATCILEPLKKAPHIIQEGDWISKSDKGILRSCDPGFFESIFTNLIPVS